MHNKAIKIELSVVLVDMNINQNSIDLTYISDPSSGVFFPKEGGYKSLFLKYDTFFLISQSRAFSCHVVIIIHIMPLTLSLIFLFFFHFIFLFSICFYLHNKTDMKPPLEKSVTFLEVVKKDKIVLTREFQD